ncbi:hypothetical protein ACVW16_001245 [Bradyrhizobium sp. USDA 4474]
MREVCKRYNPPSTAYERALAHPTLTSAVKKRLRHQYRSLDPVSQSKLDPHIATIEDWLTEQLQLWALAIVGPAQARNTRGVWKRQH